MSLNTLPRQKESITECPRDDSLVVKLLESRPSSDQKHITETKLAEFLHRAAQPRHVSGNACIELCHFVEQCRESSTGTIRDVAYSTETCLNLFDFYIEWNEKNQNRSMRQVLELVTALISQNPNPATATFVKESILNKNLAIIDHDGPRPLVKPAFKSLDCLLAKRTISTHELLLAYLTRKVKTRLVIERGTDFAWDVLVEEVFEWMVFPETSPSAGKFLVTLFRNLSSPDLNSNVGGDRVTSWQTWIRRGFVKFPDSLENVKNYLLVPLFKFDRTGSLQFLVELNSTGPLSQLPTDEMDAHALLLLVATDAGKKSGLVEESAPTFMKRNAKKSSSIPLQEEIFFPLIVHASDTVRTLAFSVLVSSLSTIVPFTSLTLEILKSGLCVLHADTDAKFRNEVLSNTKHMIERLRGATALLTREIHSLGFNSKSAAVSAASLAKEKSANADVARLLQLHERFLGWYLDFLTGELIPTASFQRHITALKALLIFLTSGILGSDSTSNVVSKGGTTWPFSIDFFNPVTLRLLLDLLMDPFEDVRVTTTTILKLVPSKAFGYRAAFGSVLPTDDLSESVSVLTKKDKSMPDDLEVEESENILVSCLTRANDTALRTGRADYADGVAHCYELVFSSISDEPNRVIVFENLVNDLVEKVTIAEENLGKAITDAPVHGLFAALNLIWGLVDHPNNLPFLEFIGTLPTGDKWNRLQIRMYHCCLRIWKVVSHVLCSESPEGHLPEDVDDNEAFDTKDILSYSFRAVHESSNLMRTMASKIKLTWQDQSSILPPDLFEAIGDLTFEQLSSLRHRGAFSTVSLTFTKICQLTQCQAILGEPSHSHLLEQFYQETLRCISDQSSTTRRSAGIPALITGILSANAPSPSLTEVMGDLKSLALEPVHLSEIDETSLPQVHAINCMKEIFKSSVLGRRAESHLTESLQIAAQSLNSKVWAIRNCGLLLIRSLIDCLFGTSESKSITEAGWDGRSIRLSYDRYQDLPHLLLKLLVVDPGYTHNSRPGISAVESVFPALDIIRRAGPPEINRDKIYLRVSAHLGSHIWHVRELAARTMCTLLIRDDWPIRIEELLLLATESSNRLHGTLLAIKFFVERRSTLKLPHLISEIPMLVHKIQASLSSISSNRKNSQVVACEIDLYNAIASMMLSFDAFQLPDFDFLRSKEIEFCGKGSALFQVAQLRASIYSSAVSKDTARLKNIVKSACQNSADLGLIALETVSMLWTFKSSSDSLKILSDAYTTAIENSTSPKLCSVALESMAELLDDAFGSNPDGHNRILKVLRDLKFCLGDNSRGPELSNSKIRISGWILRSEIALCGEKIEAVETRAQAWAAMLRSAGAASTDFDIRFAAAKSIRSFFIAGIPEIIADCMLAPLLALYDVLNDDDDEIRDVGAATVSLLLQKSLVSLAASEHLADLILDRYNGSSLLTWNIIARLTGNVLGASEVPCFSFSSARMCLLESLEEDNALFVEEEQNLFIDEVRETKLWSRIFLQLPQSALDITTENFEGSSPIQVLARWALDGLATINTINRIDRPLGWTTKPKTFAICYKVLASAQLLLDICSRCYDADLSHDGYRSTFRSQKAQQQSILGRADRISAGCASSDNALHRHVHQQTCGSAVEKFHDIPGLSGKVEDCRSPITGEGALAKKLQEELRVFVMKSEKWEIHHSLVSIVWSHRVERHTLQSKTR